MRVFLTEHRTSVLVDKTRIRPFLSVSMLVSMVAMLVVVVGAHFLTILRHVDSIAKLLLEVPVVISIRFGVVRARP